jgi:hypothetical protein
VIALAGILLLATYLSLVLFFVRLPSYVQGFAAGVFVAGMIAGIAWSYLMTDASMTWRVGALGERMTSGELCRLGPSWTVLNNLRLPTADGSLREVDHIAVGPGGVFVLDSKLWPTRTHRLDTKASPYIDAAARGARIQADLARAFLADIVPGEVVRPTVMFWGSDLLSPAELVFTNRSGVHIVHGRDAAAWLQLAGSEVYLDSAGVAAVVKALQPCLVDEQRLRDARPPRDWVRPASR